MSSQDALPGQRSGPEDAVSSAASAARDRAHGLLRELLGDVERERARNQALAAPADAARAAAPPGADADADDQGVADVPSTSSTVARARRWYGRGPVVGLVAVGVLSVGGAAAATQVPASSPVHGLGSAVRSVAGAFSGAGSAAPAAGPQRSASASPAPGPLGAVTLEQDRIEALLRSAATLLDAGRPTEAADALAAAEERIGEVPGLDVAASLQEQIEQLRRRLPPGPVGGAPGRPDAPPGAGPALPGVPAGRGVPARPATPVPTGPPAAQPPSGKAPSGTSPTPAGSTVSRAPGFPTSAPAPSSAPAKPEKPGNGAPADRSPQQGRPSS